MGGGCLTLGRPAHRSWSHSSSRRFVFHSLIYTRCALQQLSIEHVACEPYLDELIDQLEEVHHEAGDVLIFHHQGSLDVVLLCHGWETREGQGGGEGSRLMKCTAGAYSITGGTASKEEQTGEEGD